MKNMLAYSRTSAAEPGQFRQIPQGRVGFSRLLRCAFLKYHQLFLRRRALLAKKSNAAGFAR
jgi:hypothetical protein